MIVFEERCFLSNLVILVVQIHRNPRDFHLNEGPKLYLGTRMSLLTWAIK